MSDGLKLLEQWNRKYYRFSIKNNGHIQPGDGISIKLQAGGRQVTVYEEDFEDHNDDPKTIEELIIEAIRRWHADDSLKNYRIYYHVKPTDPEYQLDQKLWSWWTKNDYSSMIKVELQAKNEAEAVALANKGWPENLHKHTWVYEVDSQWRH